jgi:hypothetical protein
MSTTTLSRPTKRVGMTSTRKISLTAGLLYLLTFVSIPTLSLFKAPRADGFILTAGPDNPVLIGGLLEIVVAFAGMGTALALYPVLKRQNHGAALAFVASRTYEAATLFVGVVAILSIVSLRQSGIGADGLAAAQGLVAQRDWAFLLGGGFVPGVNALILGTLLYRSRLVPRFLPTMALIGGPLIIASVVMVTFGLFEQVSPISAAIGMLVAVWELSLGLWLTFKGFKSTPITRAIDAEKAAQIAAA